MTALPGWQKTSEMHTIAIFRMFLFNCPIMATPKAPSLCTSALLFAFSIMSSLGAAPPPGNVKDLNTPRDFPAIASREQWLKRASDIREHVLVSCGLWPMPEKTPLKPHIFGKIDREGYSVEKVYVQTLPGFYLAGNLYRPLGRGPGPFPGILNPHGHWKEGRLVDTKDGSASARCISFARQGMVAFSYDMVGYNDTHFANADPNKASYDSHRSFGAAKTDQLWSISLMGLQTWNSIRALDFLESLPDVDKKRLACTGESGGGTQTFMLGAVEDRLAAQAPIVMVSHTMQGGCSCENAPGLRVDYSNMEIAAAPAPRPQILVAATGDWTKATLTVEGPSIAHIYDLLKARDKFDFVRFDFGHNYNQTSREAVYGWFGKWLLHNPDPASLKEAPYQKEPDSDLRVFPDDKLPEDAMTREQFTESLRKLHQAQWQKMVPENNASLERFKQTILPAWRHTMELDWPASPAQVATGELTKNGEYTTAKVTIKPRGAESSIVATYWAPANLLTHSAPKVVVLAQPDSSVTTHDDTSPSGLPLMLLLHGIAVLDLSQQTSDQSHDQFTNFYSTYNRTLVQQRVGNLLAACSAAQTADARKHPRFRVVLVGIGAAGIATILAAPGADAVVADANSLDTSDDQALLAPDVFSPGLRNIGTFEGAPLLAAPHPLLLHNTGQNFRVTAIRSGYKSSAAAKKLRIEPARLSDEALANWISEL